MTMQDKAREEYARRLLLVTDEAVLARVEVIDLHEKVDDLNGQLTLKDTELDNLRELVREQTGLINEQRRHLDIVRSAGIEIHDTTDADEVRKMITIPRSGEVIFNEEDPEPETYVPDTGYEETLAKPKGRPIKDSPQA